tara:strand:- start:2137 stop:2331 length:195 start_codon:yes stop_codon:yes gene_type:complete
MKKLNGFENYIIKTAVEYWLEHVEKDVVEKQAAGVNYIYAPGYFTMVSKELLEKIDELTKKDKK